MIDEIKNELLDRGLNDLLWLGLVIQVTGRHAGASVTDRAVIKPTLKVISEMLKSGHIIAGQIARGSDDVLYVRSWDLTPEDAVARIREEWSALESLPTPGQIAWFELTDAGREEAQRISR